MPYVGGTEIAQLYVADGDVTTAATVRFIAPGQTAGDVSETPAVTTDGGKTWVAEIIYNRPDGWVQLWTVTGAGANVQPLAVFVTPIPVPGGPDWRPTLAKVATYIPGRTLVANKTTGSNVPQRTFDESTNPTGREVDQLLTDAVAWVLSATGPIADSQTLQDMAAATAAVFAAAGVERGYPDRSADVNTAADLLTLAQQMRRDLAVANEAATGEDPANPTAKLLPLYQFPPPPRWADINL